MLILHPTIYLDSAGAATDALLLRDGKVVAVGDSARQAAGAEDKRVRPDGVCVMPALADAHIHLYGLGLRAGTVDLRGLDADDALTAMADAEAQTEGWIFGTNLDDNQFSPDQRVTRADLDRLFPDNPVCIHRVDRHAVWANTAALERARFDEVYTPSAEGRAQRDADGELTGLLVDAAMEPLLSTIPEPGQAETRAVFGESIAMLHAFGIGFCTIARSEVRHLGMVQTAVQNGEIPVALDVLVDGMDRDLDAILEAGPVVDHERGFRMAGIKFFSDGALGSAGAHLLEPYRQGGLGLPIHDEGFLRRRIPELMTLGWQVAVHAIGDAANRRVLDAFEEVPAQVRRQLRPRIEHAQMVTAKDCPRFAELTVIASIQPIHLRSDAPWAPQRLSEAQLERLFPWRDLLPTPLAAGSDYPIDDPNPWHGIATALTRQGYDGEPFRPEQALTRQEIIAAYTSGAAFASHREAQFGALHPGFHATAIVVDVDPFQAPAEDIWDAKATHLNTSSTHRDHL